MKYFGDILKLMEITLAYDQDLQKNVKSIKFFVT